MKKIIALLIILVLFTACQPVKKEEKLQVQEQQQAETVGGGLENVDSIDSDLSDEQLNGMDSGFDDIQNI